MDFTPATNEIDLLVAILKTMAIKTNMVRHETSVVTVSDVQRFFVNFMKNDNVGRIASAHVVFADSEPEGVMSKQCIRLAQLHSTAVDFQKTGVPATMEQELVPKEMPDFMENDRKVNYPSEKVLGHIYRKVKSSAADYDNQSVVDKTRNSIDRRLCLVNAEYYMEEAEHLFHEYNYQLRQIMTQYDVPTEGELLSGFIYRLAKRLNQTEKEQHLKIRIDMAVRNLRNDFHDRFWNEFIDVMETHNNHEDLASSVDGVRGLKVHQLPREVYCCALQKASAWYQVSYYQGTEEGMDLRSFGYIVHYLLCAILQTCSR